MVRTLSILAASASILAYAAAADAQPRWPNWYIGLHGSMVFIDSNEVSGNPVVDAFEQDSGAGYGVSLGYRPQAAGGVWKNMRLEAQYHHQRADTDKLSTTFGSFNGQGDVRLNAGFLNIYYDAPITIPNIRPYVGIGAGWAQLHLENADPSFGLVNNDGEDSVFAWNAMAGLGYIPSWMPFTELHLGYRYLTTSDAEYALTAGGTFEMEYDSHNIEAGVKFLF